MHDMQRRAEGTPHYLEIENESHGEVRMELPSVKRSLKLQDSCHEFCRDI